jgi:hypothetical protein
MNPALSALFPNASKSCRDANPDELTQPAKQNAAAAILSAPRRQRGVMNKTEREFSLYLDAMQRKGEILRWVFEGMTLRWEGVKYTPDFVVFGGMSADFEKSKIQNGIRLIEIKGGYLKGKYERAIERFRHARSMWPEFSFEMHHRQKGAWKRIH